MALLANTRDKLTDMVRRMLPGRRRAASVVYFSPNGGGETRIFSHLLWLSIAIFASLLLSVMIAISPILAGGALVFAIVAAIASSRRAFLIYLFLLCSVPQYLAFIRPGLPWISPQRMILALLFMKLLYDAAYSKDFRQILSEKIRYNKTVWRLIISFFVILYLSIPLSGSPPQSLTLCLQATVQWFLPFIACLYVIQTDRDVTLVFRLILICTLVMVAGACVEEYYKTRLWTQLMPEDFFTNNPNFVYNWRDETRNGIYRAASIFSSQLSFAEYCAIISPIALYFLTGLKGWDRALGGVAYLACLLGIVLSQSRGGALCLVVATIVFILAVTFRPLLRREMNFRRGVVLFIVAMTMIVGAGAALNSNRVHKAFLGNGQTASSNAERAAQWQKGLPKIMQRPVLGYGLGQSVTVAGAGDSGQVSIDSYVLSLLCDTGFPGVIAFFSYLLILTFSLLRAYVRTAVDDRRFLAIGAGLSGYVLFRLVLSQFENHTMLFILTAVAFFLLMQHRQARAPK